MPTPAMRPPSLTPKQKEFLAWLVTPRDLRPDGEKTQREWCAAHQVGYTTATKWRADPEFRRAWDRQLMELQVDPENLQDVMDALLGRAKAGSEKAISMYLDVVKEFRPPQVTDPEELRAPLAELSDAELADLLSAHALAELEARQDD